MEYQDFYEGRGGIPPGFVETRLLMPLHLFVAHESYWWIVNEEQSNDDPNQL